MVLISRRNALLFSISVVFATVNPVLAKPKLGGLSPDVMGQFTDFMSDLVKLANDINDLFVKYQDQGKDRFKKAEIQKLKEALTELSGWIQNTLYNGSQPTLLIFQGKLNEPPPYRLEDFAEIIKFLTKETKNSINQLSLTPTLLALDPAYGELLKAQQKRLAIFNKIGSLKGMANRTQEKQMREALRLWESANLALESAIKSLNNFINSLK